MFQANGIMFAIYHFTSFTKLCSGVELELLSRYATLTRFDLGIICSELLFYEMVSGFSLKSRIHIKCVSLA